MPKTAIDSVEPRKIAVETQAYYFVDPPPTGPAPLLLGVHGFSQRAKSFLKVSRRMAPEEFGVAAAQGFNQLWVNDGSGKVAFSWITAYEKEDTIARNTRFLESMLDELEAEGVAERGKVFLMGFSQGSAVVYRFAQRHPDRVRGIISVCSDLPPDVEAAPEPLRDVSVLVMYGLRDKFYSTEKAEHAEHALRSAGVDVEVESFDRGHIVPIWLGDRVGTWMKDRLIQD